MLSALAAIDGFTWLSILAKAGAYAATLISAGSVLVLAGLQGLSDAGRAALRRLAVFAAVAAAVLGLARLGIRASFLTGGTLAGALDPLMLRLVAESPLGLSILVRLAGLLLILAVLARGRAATAVAVAGAVVACASFALRGHALGEPRLLLGTMVSLHMLCLAFWIGGLAPLARATRKEPPALAGALAEEFGRKATGVVAILVTAGVATLALLGAARPAVLASTYGQILAIKLALFLAVLSMAALNRFHLTPALLAGRPGAGVRLRRSILVEAALAGVILLATATLTSQASPPDAAARASPAGPPRPDHALTAAQGTIHDAGGRAALPLLAMVLLPANLR